MLRRYTSFFTPLCLLAAALIVAACGSPKPDSLAATQDATCTYSASFDGDPGDAALTVLPNQTVKKTWVLRNDGTCDWSGVRLVLASEPTIQGIAVPDAAAGTTTEASIDLSAPAAAGPGSYVGEWRLSAPDGTLFGPTMRAEVIVQTGSLSDQQNPAVLPEVTPLAPGQSGVVRDTGCTLDAAFVADVTVADGTVVQPNQSLPKTWRVRNTGTCDWQAGSSLAFVGGESMGVNGVVTVPPTQSGETADIALTLTAPARNGLHSGTWRLQSTDGTLFGEALVTEIKVGDAAAITAGDSAASAESTGAQYTQYIHNISFHSRQIFLDGQTKGNQANVFTKVGDSITDVPAFLNPIGTGNYALHEYGYLQPAINYFSQVGVRNGNSFNNKSLAAVWGWSSFDVLNPSKVGDTCPGLTPFACEISVVKPALAIILIGTNDCLSGTDPGVFEGNLRQIVETAIHAGVIPVLSTVPWDQFCDVQRYNQVIVATAVSYDVPWMDFLSATWNLDNHGISWEDGVHPSVPSSNDPTNFSEDNLHYGHTVRNLLVLHVLDAIWRQVLAY